MENVMIKDCVKEAGISKAGKPFTKYVVKYGDNYSVNTLDKNFGEYLIQNIGKEVSVQIGQNQFGYSEIQNIEGVVLEQRQGGGGRAKYSPEDIARFEKAADQKRHDINRSVSMNNAISLVSAEIRAGAKHDEPAKLAKMYADQILSWLEGGK